MPVVLTVACVLGLVGAALADVDTARPQVVLHQSGHWAVDTAAKTALHVHGGTREVDARVALPDDAATDAQMALQGETDGFVVGRDRVWAFDRSTLTVRAPTPLPVTDEKPVGIEAPGGPYLVYRNRGTLVRLGAPTAVVQAGGPLGPPIRTGDGTVWVHRPDTGGLYAFRRGAVALDDAVPAGGSGGLTVVGDVATFVDTRTESALPVRDGALAAGAPLGAELPDDLLLADQATPARLPVVEPGVPRLRLLDATGISDGRRAGAPLDVALAPGTYSAPLVSGDAIAVLELGTSTLLTFGADGTKVAELRLPPGTDASDLHRGEDGRVYVDERGGARTHVVTADGSILTVELGAGAGGAGVAGAAPDSQLAAVAPPPPGALTIPQVVPGSDVLAAGPVQGGVPLPGGGVVGPGGGVVGPGAPSGPSGGNGGVTSPGPPTPPCLDCNGGLTPPSPAPPTPPKVPAVPVGVSAQLTANDQATITWQPGSGGDAATSYTVARSAGGTITAQTGRAVFPNLPAGASYTFTVTATNASGTSAASAPSNPVSTPGPVGKAGAPPGFTAKRVMSGGQRAVDLRWTPPDPAGGTLVGYRIEGAYDGEDLDTRTISATSTQYVLPRDGCFSSAFQVQALTSADGGATSTPGDASVTAVTNDPTCTAPPNGSLSLSPASRTVAAGQTLTVTIRLDPDGQPVNGVEARLSFPSAQLTCTSIAVNDASWGITPEQSCGDGEAVVVVASITPRSTPTTVATVTFTAVGAGTANVSFVGDSRALRTTDQADVAVRKTGGVYTVT